MALNFNKQAEKGEKFLHELVLELGNKTNRSKAGRILRSVFKTLRNHLTIEENFHLISQLPVVLKPIYIDGWRPTQKQVISRTKIGFLEEVIENKGTDSLSDFLDINDVEFAVLAVFNVMRKHISEGEFKDIESVLPAQLKELVLDSDYY